MGNQTRIQSKITLKFQSALHEEEIVKFLFKRKKIHKNVFTGSDRNVCSSKIEN